MFEEYADEVELCAEVHRRGIRLLGEFRLVSGVSTRTIYFPRELEITESFYEREHSFVVYFDSKRAYRWELDVRTNEVSMRYNREPLDLALNFIRKRQALQDLANV